MLYPYRLVKPLIIAVAIALIIVQAPAQAQKRIALVIGNGDFPDPYKLAQPENDATSLAAALEATGFLVTTLKNADLTVMAKAGRAFLDAAPGAELRLFYYSGYAVQAGGSNWLVPARSDASKAWSAKAEAFSADSILSGLAAAGPGTNVLILDACRDSPFSDRSGAKGIAKMDAENSIVAFAAGPGSTVSDDPSRAMGAFTEAVAAALPSPGRSLQEILYAAAASVEASSASGQSPWISTSLTELRYLSTPQEAFQAVLAAKTEAESAVKQLEARVDDLQARSSVEKDESQRRVYEAEFRAQADLLETKKKELDVLKNEQQRQVSTNESIDQERAALETIRIAQAEDESAIGDLALLRRWEIATMVDRAESSDDRLAAIESAASMRADISNRLDSFTDSFLEAVDAEYARRIGAISSWKPYPWESGEDFGSRAAAERIRLRCGRQAAGNALALEAAARRKTLLQPFDDAGAKARDGLDLAKDSYSGDDIAITVGAFDRDSSSYSITLDSRIPELPFSASVTYSIAADDPDALRDRYKQFEAWRSAKAFAAEIDASLSAVEGIGYAAIVDAFRLKVADGSGTRLLADERPSRPVAYFKGSADRSRPTPVSSWLSAVGYSTDLSINGGREKRDRLFVLNPKAGDYVVRATFNGGSFEERRVAIAEGGHALVEFRLGSFTIPWLAAGSTVNVRKLSSAPQSERAKGKDSVSDEFMRSFSVAEASAFRSPLLPEGTYRVVIAGEYPYAADLVLSPGIESKLPGYVDNLTATMTASRASLVTAIDKKRARTKIGLIALGAGAAGAVGAAASYFLGADAAEDLRNAKGTPEAEDAHLRVDIYSIVFPITAVIGAAGLGVSPGLLLPGQSPSKLKKSIDMLDEQIKALSN